jgi:hypothetical protein
VGEHASDVEMKFDGHAVVTCATTANIQHHQLPDSLPNPVRMQKSSVPDDHGYRWHTRRGKLSRHVLVLLALVTNACIAALALIVQWVNIPLTDAELPRIGSVGGHYTYKSLLAPASSLLGSMNSFLSMAAIAMVVKCYAKWRGIGKGLSLKQIGWLGKLGECSRWIIKNWECQIFLLAAGGGIPMAVTSWALLAILILAADALTRAVSHS